MLVYESKKCFIETSTEGRQRSPRRFSDCRSEKPCSAKRRVAGIAVAAVALATCSIPALASPEQAHAVWVDQTWKAIRYTSGNLTRITYTEGSLSYCLQPQKKSPSSGNYRKVYVRGMRNWEQYAAGLYFGLGGPGFDYAVANGWYPERNWNGRKMTWNDYYVATHIYLSWVYPNAPWNRGNTLAGANASFRRWAERWVFDHMSYYQERNLHMVPDAYKNNVFICPTGGRTQDIGGCGWVSSGGIQVHKRQYGTNAPMAGIRFDIYNSNASGAIGSYVSTITTDGAGNAATLPNALPLGYYMLVEANPPSGCDQVRRHVYVGTHFAYAYHDISNVYKTQVTVKKRFSGPVFDTELVLRRDGVEIASVSTGGAETFSYTWKNLLKYDNMGREYKYEVGERGESGGVIEHDGVRYKAFRLASNSIANTQVMESFSVKKVWADEDNRYGSRPDEVKVFLRKINENTGVHEDLVDDYVALNEDNGWQGEFKDVPIFEPATGEPVRYEVHEVREGAIKAYSESVEYESYTDEGASAVVTNTLEMSSIHIDKSWVGSNPKPDELTFHISSNDGAFAMEKTVTASEAESGFDIDVPKVGVTGHPRIYDVQEGDVEGYKPSKKSIGNSFHFTNISTEEYDIPISKTWIAQSAAIPDTATFTVKRSEKEEPSDDSWAALYTKGDSSYLVFGRGEVPTHWLGKCLEAQWAGIETATRDFESASAPWQWFPERNITKVLYEDELRENRLKPLSCSFWFAGMESLWSLDLRFLDTSESTDFTGMFDNLPNLQKITLSGAFSFTGKCPDEDRFALLPSQGSETNRRADGIWHLDSERLASVGGTGLPATSYSVEDFLLTRSWENASDPEQDYVFYAYPVADVYVALLKTADGKREMKFFNSETAPKAGDKYWKDGSEMLLVWNFTDFYRNNDPNSVDPPWVEKFTASSSSENVMLMSADEYVAIPSLYHWLWKVPYVSVIDAKYFDTSDATSMCEWLYRGGAWSTNTVRLYDMDTSNVTNMRRAFDGNTITAHGLDTAKVTDMSEMFGFAGAANIAGFDFSSFDTSNVTNMYGMFGNQLIQIGRASQDAFLDISSFDTSKVTNTQYMFRSMKVRDIYVGPKWDMSHVTVSHAMFYGTEVFCLDGKTVWCMGSTATNGSQTIECGYGDVRVANTGSMGFLTSRDSCGECGQEIGGFSNKKSFDKHTWEPRQVVLSSAGGWSGKFSVERYGDDGEHAEYYLEEEPVKNFHTTIEGNQYDGFSAVNVESSEMTIEKVWDGLDYSVLDEVYRSKVEDGIDVSVMAVRQNGGSDSYSFHMDGEMNETGESVWTQSFPVPRYDRDGVEYADYVVEETDDLKVLSNENIPGDVSEYYYESTVENDFKASGKVTLTNTLSDSDTSKLTVKKIWNDEGHKSDSVKVSVARSEYVKYQGGAPDGTETETGTNVKEDVSRQSDDVLLSFELTREEVAAAESKDNVAIEVQDDDGIVVWRRDIAPEEYRRHMAVPCTPLGGKVFVRIGTQLIEHVAWKQYVRVTGEGDIVSELELNEANGWTSTIEDLETFSEGTSIEDAEKLFSYHVFENIPEVPAGTDGFFVPTYSFEDPFGSEHLLADCDEQVDLVGRHPSFAFTIENHLVTGEIDIPVEKQWDDRNGIDGLRPNEVTVRLLARGERVAELSLNEENRWSGKFESVPYADGDGNVIEYSIEEEPVPYYAPGVVSGNALTGFDVVNRLQRISVSVEKQWNDEMNIANLRPRSVRVELTEDDTPTGIEATLSSASDWKCAFADLLAYGEDGKPRSYGIQEEEVFGYVADIEYKGNVEDGALSATIVNTLSEADVKVSKKWNTLKNDYPDSVEVRLIDDGKPYIDEHGSEKHAVLSSSNGWQSAFEGVSLVNEDGILRNLTVEELFVGDSKDKYSASVSGSLSNGFVVTNTEKMSIPVYKVWEDSDDADGIRPGSVEVGLYDAKSGILVNTISLGADSTWKGTFYGVEKYDSDGSTREYSVVENPVPGYTSTVSGTAENGFVITNSHETSYTSLRFKKTFDDGDNQDGIRPTSLTIRLLKNGTPTSNSITLSAGDDGIWQEEELSGEFEHLDIKDPNGEYNDYTVQEDSVLGSDGQQTYRASYSTLSDGTISIVNVHVPETFDLPVEKIWYNAPSGFEEKSLHVYLHANGKAVPDSDGGVEILEQNASGDWTAVFEKLPIYDSEGVPITYTVEEDAAEVAGIVQASGLSEQLKACAHVKGKVSPTPSEWSSEDPQITLSNTFTFLLPEGEELPDELSEPLKVTNKWIDNEDSPRPPSVTVSLEGNGEEIPGTETVLDEDNEWTVDYGSRPSFDEEGEPIVYTVKSDEIDKYYSDFTTDPDDRRHLIITRTAIGDFHADKVWDDNDNAAGIRPSSVTVSLDIYRHSNEFSLTAEQSLDMDKLMYNIPGQLSGKNVKGNFYVDAANTQTSGIEAVMYDKNGLILDEVPCVPMNGSDNGNGLSFSFGYKVPEGARFALRLSDGSSFDTSHVDSVSVYDDEVYLYDAVENTLSTDNGWHCEWSDMDLFDAINVPYVFKMSENQVEGYESSIKENGTSYVITNTLIDDITVIKRWFDTASTAGSPLAGEHPPVTVSLYRNGTKLDGRELVLSEENSWTGKFEDVEWSDESGQAFDYTVVEENVPDGYSPQVSGELSKDRTFVISNVPTTDVAISKTWAGDEEHLDARPESVGYAISPIITDNISLSKPDDDLGVTDEKSTYREQWQQQVRNAARLGMETYSKSTSGTVTVFNMGTGATSLVLRAGDGNETREQSFTIAACGNEGNSTATYRVDDFILENMSNMELAPVSDNDTLLDDMICSGDVSIVVSLRYRGTSIEGTLNASDGWSTTVENLPMLDGGLRSIEYAVSETNVPEGYSASVKRIADGSGDMACFKITNEYGKKSIDVEKVWNDSQNKDNIRPASVEIELVRDGNPTGRVVMLSQDNGWKGQFSGLDDANSDGSTVTYSVRENDVPDGYECIVHDDSVNETSSIIVENVHECLVDIPVKKVWDDYMNLFHARPSVLSLLVVSNEGTPAEKVVMKETISGSTTYGEWEYEISGLPFADESGEAITYSIREEVPEGYYQSSMTSSQMEGVVMTNKSLNMPLLLPLTGAAAALSLVLLGFGTVLAAIGFAMRKEGVQAVCRSDGRCHGR